MEDASPHRELASSHRDLSVPPSRFSKPHTKRELSGHLYKKVAGNSNKSEIPAEVSTNLRRKLFFFFWSSPVGLF